MNYLIILLLVAQALIFRGALRKLERLIQMKAEEALQLLTDANNHLTEIGTEVDTLLQKVTNLENAAANADIPQAVADAITGVSAQAKVVDDKVPDVTPAPTP